MLLKSIIIFVICNIDYDELIVELKFTYKTKTFLKSVIEVYNYICNL